MRVHGRFRNDFISVGEGLTVATLIVDHDHVRLEPHRACLPTASEGRSLIQEEKSVGRKSG